MVYGNSKEIKILKQTKSICPECLLELNATIIRTNNKIVLKRECPTHGEFCITISNNPAEFEELFHYYHELNLINEQQRIKKQYTIFYTNKCNINCPICFMNANFEKNIPDPSNALLADLLKYIKKKKINIFGGEPTVRNDLPELISLIKNSGNFSTLFTNGIKISDLGYLRTLKQAGLGEIHLQFDGFNESTDLKFRNINLLKYKFKALENAKILNIPVVFEVTIDQTINSQEISHILNYAFNDWHIRGICFRSYFALGRRGVKIDAVTIDELISDVEKNTQGKIKGEYISILQKLVYIMAEWFNFNWCFSHRYMLIYRKKNKGWMSINEIFNLNKIKFHLDTYLSIKKRNNFLAKLYFILIIVPNMLQLKSIGIFLHLLIVIMASRFCHALTQSSFGTHFLVIDFESPCDIFTFNLEKVCNTKVIGEDLKIYPSFYEASLQKERFFQESTQDTK